MNRVTFDDLKGKNCVITGGAGILGSEMAKALASAGVNLAIIDLNPQAATGLAQEIADVYRVKATGVSANVLDKASLETAREQINLYLGNIDFLINGAGGNSPKATTKAEQIDPSHEIFWENTFFGLEEEGVKHVFDLNFMGTLLPTMVFGRQMVERGSGVIINISSMNALKPLTKIPAYSAAKSAVNNFTEWLAVHFGKTGIRVNAIAPGFFLTNQNRFLLTNEQTGELTDRGKKIISSTPMGKFGNPGDLNGTLLYLLSDLSAFVTGVVIPVDGGFNAYGRV